MIRGVVAACAFAICSTAQAASIESVYTEIDVKNGCAAYDQATGEEGDFLAVVCPGYMGYAVLISYGDLRESVFYGFPKAPETEGETLVKPWESFSGFNSTADKIEWRVEMRDGLKIPIAAIHRWFVSADPENADKQTEVLVVSKVGQVGAQDGCTIGLVLATGNPKANETARKIADEQATTFACGADERVIVGDPMPEFSRAD
jgi:hypothetical protein